MPIITVSHLTKQFQVYKRKSGAAEALISLFHRQKINILAVNDVSFTVKEGELVGFIGPNGAGKTTTMKCLAGLLYPSEGTVSVMGFRPSDRKTDYLKKISLIMGQRNQLWWDLPAKETFILNKEIYGISDEKYNAMLKQLMTLLDAKDLPDIPVRQLSLGQRMKMELIASLLHKPKMLFLDEPTIGLDVVMQKRMRDFIKSINKEFHTTILLTSHYMSDVKELCKRVIVINRGTILFDGSLDVLIKKYVNHKLITVETTSKINEKELKKLGTVISKNPHQITLSVPRSKSNSTALYLLKAYPVNDLTIKDPEIEDVIRIVFTQQMI